MTELFLVTGKGGVGKSTTSAATALQQADSGKKVLLILIKKNQLAKEIGNARPSRFVKGDKVDAMIVELDKKKRKVI